MSLTLEILRGDPAHKDYFCFVLKYVYESGTKIRIPVEAFYTTCLKEWEGLLEGEGWLETETSNPSEYITLVCVENFVTFTISSEEEPIKITIPHSKCINAFKEVCEFLKGRGW